MKSNNENSVNKTKSRLCKIGGDIRKSAQTMFIAGWIGAILVEDKITIWSGILLCLVGAGIYYLGLRLEEECDDES